MNPSLKWIFLKFKNTINFFLFINNMWTFCILIIKGSYKVPIEVLISIGILISLCYQLIKTRFMVTWHPIPHLSTLHLVWSSLETLMLYNQIYYDDKNIRSIFYFFSLFLCILSYYLDWYMFYIKICKLNTLFSKDAFRRILRQSQGKIMPFAFYLAVSKP